MQPEVGVTLLDDRLDYGEADFEAVAARFVAACRRMEQDGWWWSDAAQTNRSIRRRILKEMASQYF